MCDCIKKIDEKLAEVNSNTKLKIVWSMSGAVDRAMVVTEKADKSKRGEVSTVFASYCPFCGEKYPDSK